MPVALIADALAAGKAVAAICADLGTLPAAVRGGMIMAGSGAGMPAAITRALVAALGAGGAA